MFFAAVFVYVFFIIDPRLLYHAYIVPLPGRDVRIVFPEFFLGREFLASFAHLPGGAAEYVGAMGSQWFFYDTVGAIILTALALCLFALTAGIARKIGLRHGRLMGLVAALIWVAAWGRYTFHLADQLALLGALVLVRLYVGARHPAVRTVGFIVLSPVVYVMVAGPYLLAAVVCGLFELLARHRKVPAAVCFAVGVCVPAVVGVRLLGANALDAYLRMTGLLALEPLESSRGPWEALLAAVLGAWFIGLVAGPWAIRRLIGQGNDAALIATARPRSVWRHVAVVAVVAIGAGAAVACYDHQAGRVLRINRYSKIGQWNELLDVAATCRPDDMSSHSRRQINRALFETRQLGDRMFAFPQHADGLLPGPVMEDIVFGLEEDLLAVGAVNQAEHLAAEALMIRGPTPHLLRVLAKAFLAKGERQAAKIFLTRLRGDLIHGRWARECMEQLARDPEMSADSDIQHIRSVMPRRDVVGVGDLEATLIRLLEANAGNRMAFEYLMAYYLLNWRLDDLAAAMETEPAAIHYQTLPEHVAEALIIHSAQAPGSASLNDLRISEAALRRAERFEAATATHGGNPQALNEALATDLPDSYFRYYRTGQSGRSRP
ncbi:MAG: DUF6057 family protein [Planctomycetota bacterium]